MYTVQVEGEVAARRVLHGADVAHVTLVGVLSLVHYPDMVLQCGKVSTCITQYPNGLDKFIFSNKSNSTTILKMRYSCKSFTCPAFVLYPCLLCLPMSYSPVTCIHFH